MRAPIILLMNRIQTVSCLTYWTFRCRSLFLGDLNLRGFRQSSREWLFVHLVWSVLINYLMMTCHFHGFGKPKGYVVVLSVIFMSKSTVCIRDGYNLNSHSDWLDGSIWIWSKIEETIKKNPMSLHIVHKSLACRPDNRNKFDASYCVSKWI